MELKTLESDVSFLCTQYEYLRKALDEKQIEYEDMTLALPSINDRIISHSESINNASIMDHNNGVDDANNESFYSSLVTWRDKVLGLQEKTDKFRKRLLEKDPITGANRYGEKTSLRVKNLLSNHEEFLTITNTSLAKDVDDNADNISILKALESIIQEQNNIQSKKQKEIETIFQNELKSQKEINALQKQKEEEERLAEIALKEKEELELFVRAEELRKAKNEEMQRIKDNERNFLNSIIKGEKGIKIQLQKLKESTNSNANDYKTAIHSLHTVYSQILSHPEEVKHRKIRRDHPKFLTDIGRHDGGIEFFIASGFTLENSIIDDNEISCLFSQEPDIEHDMERWTEWFDLLKLTLELIKKERSTL